MLNVEQLRYRYQQQSFQFDFTLDTGQLLAVQGRSGIGKSTLLDLIAGFLTPIDGNIRWHGQSLLTLPIEQRPISQLFQANNLFEHLTVQANLHLGMGTPVRSTLMDELQQAGEALGVADLLQRKPSALSGGQRQRIALIRAVLRPEPLLLLDEPFTGLDDASRHRVIHWLQNELSRSGKTTILVTHQQDDVKQLADQLIQLDSATSQV